MDRSINLFVCPDDLTQLIEGVAFKNAISKLDMKFYELSVEEQEVLLKPTGTDFFLKNAFWNEIRKSLIFGGKIKPEAIYGGICTYTHWFNNILNNPKKLAWIISPCRDVSLGVRELKVWLLDKMREILSLDIKDDEGNPRVNVIREIIRANEVLLFSNADGGR